MEASGPLDQSPDLGSLLSPERPCRLVRLGDRLRGLTRTSNGARTLCLARREHADETLGVFLHLDALHPPEFSVDLDLVTGHDGGSAAVELGAALTTVAKNDIVTGHGVSFPYLGETENNRRGRRCPRNGRRWQLLNLPLSNRY